jgi:hypothetical protein
MGTWCWFFLEANVLTHAPCSCGSRPPSLDQRHAEITRLFRFMTATNDYPNISTRKRKVLHEPLIPPQ